jgi:hypothetical protein
VIIYRKSGTHVGFENNSAAWAYIDSVTVTDAGGHTYIPIHTGPLMVAGSTTAFYVRGNVDYTSGAAVGTTIASNADLSIKSGTGVNGIFGTNNANREFEGTVHYCKPQTVVCDTIQTVYNNTNGNFGAYFDVTTLTNPITVNQLFIDIGTPEGTLQNVKLYTRPSTHVGNEGAILGWTLISDDTIVSPLPDSPEAISTGISVNIPANSTQSFFVLTELGLDYTNGTATGDIAESNSFVQIKTGVGTAGTFGSTLNQARIINGTIDYCVGSGLGMDENGIKTFKIYPNPVTSEISVDFGELSATSIKIVDIHGQTVMTKVSNKENGIVKFDTSGLSPGTYFVKSTEDSEFKVQKFVKL